MTPLSIDHVERIQEHTQRIRSFAALLLWVLLAEHVIGRDELGDDPAAMLVGSDEDTRAIDTVAQDAGPSGDEHYSPLRDCRHRTRRPERPHQDALTAAGWPPVPFRP
jgi:hypothetical protein